MYEHFIHFITYNLSFRIGALITFMWASNFCIAINRDDLLKKVTEIFYDLGICNKLNEC